ncbi:hypothetical protein FIBSPDRAFT_967186 [Athelia psychrophila]|uniref:Uncharacterized protein n=1 Tax=Athelia psychrophila TaxID=1759441 RepID=A0A167W076_9AGAM|nr:hypothetical protein FIBSPDRAFT_967186 [Fibularhizoctonia sp. CBS 109695]
MGQHLLPIRILFHVAFAFTYQPIIVLGLATDLPFSMKLDSGDGVVQFSQHRFDGIAALASLVGLGIFAALDILTIRGKVNERAFLAIEMFVVVLLPLSMWPIIISGISVIWPDWFQNFSGSLALVSNMVAIYGTPAPGFAPTDAFIIATTFTILGLNTTCVLYITLAAAMDKVQGRKFMFVYLAESSVSSPGTLGKWRFFGTRRTPIEQAAIVSRCSNYIFQNSIFRKHAFEPTAWAIFRGTIAVYSCVGLVAFAAYSAVSEAQKREAFVFKETLTVTAPFAHNNDVGLHVTSYLMGPSDPLSLPNPDLHPPPTITGKHWQNVLPGVWTPASYAGAYQLPNFNLSWSGDYTLVVWITQAGNFGSINKTQVKSTNPLVLAPFKQYSTSLLSVTYLSSLWFISFLVSTLIFHGVSDSAHDTLSTDVITSVDSISGSNTSMSSFSFNRHRQQFLLRDLRPPSIFSSVAQVLSDIGGTLSSIDGVFALVLGRTIVAILFGSRVISPFGLLGMVTRDRFKRLIHEQYPRMLDDIERGGMAAYISEVAINAALIDVSSAERRTGSSESSCIGDETGDGNPVGLRHMQVGSSASYPRLLYMIGEFGDSESNTLVGGETDHE